jgi:phenylacetate-CoA ligase
MSVIPDIEADSFENIKKFQEHKLRDVLSYVAKNSPFYKDLFASRSITVEKIQYVEDLRIIPPTTKDDLQKRNWDFLCVPKTEIVEYTSTSGTLGKPVTIGLTANDLERLAYNESISFSCAGASSTEVFQLMLTLDRQFMAGIAYYQGIRKLGAAVIRVGPGLPAMQLEAIQRLQPTVLVAVPSFLVRLVEYAKAQGVDLNQTSVKKAVCIGESIRAQDFELNIIGRKIREHWNIQLSGTYASTEMQTAFTECAYGRGGHLHPELILVEILDEHDKPVGPGNQGEVTVTTLGIEGMPLVRYKTGDIATAYAEPCECGRNTIRLGPVLGRKQQLIKFKGTTIYPPGIFEILNDISCIRDYVVEAFTSDLGTDEIRLYVVADGPYQDDAVKTLAAAFQSRLRVIPQINLTSTESLEKMQFGLGERKMKRFIDNR